MVGEPVVDRSELRPRARVQINRLPTGGVEVGIAHTKPLTQLPLHATHRGGERDVSSARVLGQRPGDDAKLARPRTESSALISTRGGRRRPRGSRRAQPLPSARFQLAGILHVRVNHAESPSGNEVVR
jgi:hypothetical protein